MKFVILPLSITSSWGNGHATNYRSLGKALAGRGHEVTFLERDVPWYAAARDLAHAPYAEIQLYGSIDDLKTRFHDQVRSADVVIVGSYVPEGVQVSEWVTSTCGGISAFYDIDTPVTLEKLRSGDYEYLAPELIPRFDLYLSFTGGPTLDVLQGEFRARRAVAFYCIFDPNEYHPVDIGHRWDLGYLGTHSEDRERSLEKMLVEVARLSPDARFCVAGPNHPDERWPGNIDRIHHLPPRAHREFYCAQRFTLNVTRAQMIAAGYSPSVRLFEAAACGVPIISDNWPGLEDFFVPGKEILIAESTAAVLDLLRQMSDERRAEIATAARRRVIDEHTADQRVEELEIYLNQAMGARHETRS